MNNNKIISFDGDMILKKKHRDISQGHNNKHSQNYSGKAKR